MNGCSLKDELPPKYYLDPSRPIMEILQDDSAWDGFLDHLLSRAPKIDETLLTEAFIRSRNYRPIVKGIIDGTYEFGNPIRYEIAKPGKKSKRKVYTFKRPGDVEIHTVLRVLSWAFNKYADMFAPNLYSCNDSDGVRGAVHRMTSVSGFSNKYVYKGDLSDFFNSIDVDMLFEDLYSDIDECDHDAVAVLERILRNPVVLSKTTDDDGKPVSKLINDDSKGVMAGMPFASFLSNYYLRKLDWTMHEQSILFFRYADDIIVLGDTKEELDEKVDFIHEYINKRKLSINPDKEFEYGPGDEFIFLGVKFKDGKSMLSDASIMKQKKKVKAFARRYRSMYNNGTISRDVAFVRMISHVNDYFYGCDVMPYCFARMYFPMLTSSEGLSIIDNYVQDCIRYVYVGKFAEYNKARVPYSRLVDAGYLPLVSAFRIYKES